MFINFSCRCYILWTVTHQGWYWCLDGKKSLRDEGLHKSGSLRTRDIWIEYFLGGKKSNKILPHLNEFKSIFFFKRMREGQHSRLGRFCFHLQSVFNLCRLYVLGFGPYLHSSVQKNHLLVDIFWILTLGKAPDLMLLGGKENKRARILCTAIFDLLVKV